MSIEIQKNISVEGKHQKPLLVDIYTDGAPDKKPLVIFCHGYKGFKDWGCWDLVAEAFAKAGFCFIKFNFAYNGGTVDNPIDFPDLEAFGNNNFTKELDDLETLIDWVYNANDNRMPNINLANITLIGHSRGGGIVTILGKEDRRIARIISWAGVSDLRRMLGKEEERKTWKETGVRYIVNGRTKQEMPHYYQFYEDFKKNEARLTLKTAVKNIDIPHCIIHGDADESVPFLEAEQLHQWNPNSVLYAIANANHVFGGKHPWEDAKMPNQLQEVVLKSISFIKEN